MEKKMTEPDMTINEATEFAYKNVGYGLTTFEWGSDFTHYEDGRLFTRCFDSGMEWKNGMWTFDGGLGMRTYLVRKSDMTPDQIAEANDG
jgi:hypothetical protein